MPSQRQLIATLVALALAAAGCGSSESSDERAATPSAGAAAVVSSPFVGQVASSDALVAVVVEDGKAWAYVCDGTAAKEGKVAAYLTGSVEGSKVVADSDEGVRIDATISGDEVSGEVVLKDGTIKTFVAEKASGEAGWFTASEAGTASVELGSWIRTNDGTTRGKVVVAATSGEGSSGATQGELDAGSIPPDAVPAGLFTCFRAKRRYISALVDQKNALSAGGIFQDDVDAAFDAQLAACGDKAYAPVQ